MCVVYTDLNKAYPKVAYPLPSIDRLVGATYQKLMDKVFKDILGKNIVVYINGMVAKSSDSSDHPTDLTKIFTELRRYHTRLNSEKCIFRVRRGKFYESYRF